MDPDPSSLQHQYLLCLFRAESAAEAGGVPPAGGDSSAGTGRAQWDRPAPRRIEERGTSKLFLNFFSKFMT